MSIESIADCRTTTAAKPTRDILEHYGKQTTQAINQSERR